MSREIKRLCAHESGASARRNIDAGEFFMDNVVKYVVCVTFPLRDRGFKK